jgi:glycine/D-amino acid oxidase-like deaminating enzyme
MLNDVIKLPDKEESPLRLGKTKPTYPKLKKNIEVDTVVVGGGIAGISTAYLLKRAGQKVAVLEKDTIGYGTTGHTTGKVTSHHNLMYADMSHRLGESKTRIYGQANETAVNEIEKIIKKENIDCGWERADNYVYTTDRERLAEFKKEAKVAANLGLPASFENKTPLPFKVTAAVRFANQAHFSAQKYIDGLAKAINGGGSYIFEKTRATRFRDGRPAMVSSADGKVTAGSIVIATNVPTFPLLARFSYCFMEYPTTSYLVALRTKTKINGGMYISPDSDNFSLLPIGKGSGQLLLVGGLNHIPGTGRAKPRHQRLAEYADGHFGVTKVEYRWGARDYLAYDSIPLIGRLYPWSKHIYVATAFKKWGLSHSYVAAAILRDTILGQPNSWASTYDSLRKEPVLSIPRAIAGHK